MCTHAERSLLTVYKPVHIKASSTVHVVRLVIPLYIYWTPIVATEALLMIVGLPFLCYEHRYNIHGKQQVIQLVIQSGFVRGVEKMRIAL